MDTLTTADLPESMTLAAPTKTRRVTPVLVLTCQHGPACHACILEAARRIVETDASLSRDAKALAQPYTG